MEEKPQRSAFHPVYLSGRKREKRQPVSYNPQQRKSCVLEERTLKSIDPCQTNKCAHVCASVIVERLQGPNFRVEKNITMLRSFGSSSN